MRSDVARAWGIVSTPKWLVDFMVNLVSPPRTVSVLEPACGDCPFLRTFAAKFGYRHEFWGVEINSSFVKEIKRENPWIRLVEGDYILWNPQKQFDIIIGNPPYGIIGDKSLYPIHFLRERKNEYKKIIKTWKGKYNIYAAFIEKSVHLLRDGGKMVLVVPATWMVLDDFSLLRQFLAYHGALKVFYLGGGVFPGKRVSVVVLYFEKGVPSKLTLYLQDKPWLERENYLGELIRFDNEETRAFEVGKVPLGSLFDIKFAARSTEFYKLPQLSNTKKPGYVPVLTGRNLSPGTIDYESVYSGIWIPKEMIPNIRAFYGFPHLVVAHTKGAKVVAAIDWKCYPWREEFHLVPKTQIDIAKVEKYLNSPGVQKYVRSLYRDMSPHLTRTMLKMLPIDPEEV